MIKTDLTGLIVELPDLGLGVIVDALKQNKTIYHTTLLMKTGNIVAAKLRYLGRWDKVECLEWNEYYTKELLKCLDNH